MTVFPDYTQPVATVLADPPSHLPCVRCGKHTWAQDPVTGQPTHSFEAGTDGFDCAVYYGTRGAFFQQPPARLRPRYDVLPQARALLIQRREEFLAQAEGDVQAAVAAIRAKDGYKGAIADAMDLWDQTRAGGRYEPTYRPAYPDIMRKPGKQQADQIWEGRPGGWKRDVSGPIVVLDQNASFLNALKTHLPIGTLTFDDSGAYDPRRSGVWLIEPPAWTLDTLPPPLGVRDTEGPVWVPDPLLRLYLRCAHKLQLCEPPRILQSWTSGATEGLLVGLRETLAGVRSEALAGDDPVMVEAVKKLYSKFVATCGESRDNHRLQRPDWFHIIRSRSFCSLWERAYKAVQAGLEVHTITGTDELHVAGDWRAVFTEGRELDQVKIK